MRGLLAHGDFRRLTIGQAVSALGDWMGTVALMIFVLQLTGSSTAVGGVLVLRLLPSVVAAPLAARAVGRWGRRQIMLTADWVRAVMAVLLPLLPLLGWVYSWAFAIEVVGLAFLPARDAAIPHLVRTVRGEDPQKSEQGRADLALADGIMLATSYATIPLGAGAFGLISWIADSAGAGGYWRYVVVFWIDAATYLVSYYQVRRIRDLGRADASTEAEDQPAPSDVQAAPAQQVAAPTEPLPTVKGQVKGPAKKQGFLGALRIPLVRSVLPAIAMAGLGLGALFSLGAAFVEDVMDASSVDFGILVALFGVGGAIGLALIRLRPNPERAIPRVRAGVAAQGAVIAAMSAVAVIPLSFVGAVLFGASATVAMVEGLGVVQTQLAGAERDLALTAFHVSLRFGLAVSAVVTGAVADLLNPVHLPLVGRLEPAQLVLGCAGVVVLASSALVRSVPMGPAAGTGPPAEPTKEVSCQSP